MRIGIALFIAMALALLFHFGFHSSIGTFIASASALILLSKILGDATEHISSYIGEGRAGLVNVTLSNLAELIIIYAAVRKNLIDLVQAGIVGSMIGNILLVMGLSIYFGCKKNGTMPFNRHTASLYINQFFLVACLLLLPTMFNSRIDQELTPWVSWVQAAILMLVYLFYFRLSQKDPRFKQLREQSHQLEKRWTKRNAILVLILSAIGAFVMSELLVREVEQTASSIGISSLFAGFIVLPLLGNIAEHAVAVTAARKGMTELSLSIALGSASQVGMVIAPAAVFFGLITGNTVLLSFRELPLGILIMGLVAGYLVLRDHEWNVNEGVMLLALYASMFFMFALSH